jgi:hypothetical protein
MDGQGLESKRTQKESVSREMLVVEKQSRWPVRMLEQKTDHSLLTYQGLARRITSESNGVTAYLRRWGILVRQVSQLQAVILRSR